MADKVQLIKEEIERRIKETESMQPKFDQFWAGQISAFKGVIKIIDSLPEELTVKGITWEDVNTLHTLINQVRYEFPNGISEKSFGLAVLERFQDCQDDIEYPISKNLEEEIDRFEDWLNNFNQSDYPTSYTVRDIARHFANWQHGKDFDDLLQSEMKFPKEFYEKGKPDMREEMMNDAIEVVVTNTSFIPLPKLDIQTGDKVKIIIVKTEQQ